MGVVVVIKLSAAKFFCWIKDHGYWALAIAVVMIAMVAIGAYIWNFKALPISSDTGKWADFATYLSGTVGVAAVVATLVAFVITLRQQSKLVDSQEYMLLDQRKNYILAERKYEVEKAYQIANDIFPLMVKNIKISLGLLHYVIFHDVGKGHGVPIMSSTMHEFFCLDEALFSKIKKQISSPVGNERQIIEEAFAGIGAAYKLVDECVSQSSDYVYFFDSWLAEDFGYGMPGVFYFECIAAFYRGLGEGEEFWISKLIGYKRTFGLTGEYAKIFLWQQLGEMLKENK